MDTLDTASRVLETDRSVVEAELARLLSEKKFASAPQMSSFLTYIVSQTLDGKGDRIKAYTVGVDALGKPYTFDAQSDPSVRVLALRLRKTLAGIYESGDRCHAQIVLKVGTYVPEFLKADATEKPTLTNERTSAKEDSLVLPASGNETPRRDSVPSSTAARVQVEPQDIKSSQLIAGTSAYSPAHPVGGTIRATSVRTANVGMNDPKLAMLLSALFVFFCLWLLSSDNNASYTQKLSAGMPLPLVGLQATAASADAPALSNRHIPTLYLVDDENHSKRLRQVSILMGSSVVQSGSLNVVRVSPTKVPTMSSQGDYHLVFNEVLVDGRARIDAQILRLQSGIVVSSSTLLFDNTSNSFSTEEVRQVEGFARSIADASGSLYTDFCVVQQGATPASCGTEEASSNSAAIVVNTFGAAV